MDPIHQHLYRPFKLQSQCKSRLPCPAPLPQLLVIWVRQGSGAVLWGLRPLCVCNIADCPSDFQTPSPSPPSPPLQYEAWGGRWLAAGLQHHGLRHGGEGAGAGGERVGCSLQQAQCSWRPTQKYQVLQMYYIEPRTVLRYWQSDALTTRLDLIHI